MRVTNRMQTIQISNTLQQGEDRLNTLMQQSATGLRVTQPSDDPLATEQILALKGTLSSNTQYAKNMTMGNSWLTAQDSALSGANSALVRLKQLAVMLSSDTYSASDRANEVAEVNQIKQQLINLGNSQVGTQYVFAGSKTNTPPFDATGAYQGNDDAVSIQIDGSNTAVINSSGGKIFAGTAGGVDIMTAVSNFASALSTNNLAGIQQAMTDFDNGTTRVLAARADVGARINLLETAGTMNDSLNVNLQKVISDNQDVDTAKVYSDLAQQQTAFQAALQATSIVENISLVDYIK